MPPKSRGGCRVIYSCNTKRLLGIQSTPAYLGEPECNGTRERRIRTLKEERLCFHDFASLDEAREVIGDFIRRYNDERLLERFGHRFPTEIRESFAQIGA